MLDMKEGRMAIFKDREKFGSNVLHTVLALGLWLGTIHFNVILVLFAIFFLPLSKALLLVFFSLSLSLSLDYLFIYLSAAKSVFQCNWVAAIVYDNPS